MEDTAQYLKKYTEDTDKNIIDDPQKAIGGMWKEIGDLQYNFMINQGLKPESTLLDLGCGTLRAGIIFINYLNKRKYFGQDVSKEAIDYANKSVKGYMLDEKSPKFFLTGDLTFKHTKRKYDYILAQSVFSHLPFELIQTCFENIGKIMHDKSRFYFTFRPKTKEHRRGFHFFYDLNVFQILAVNNGFNIKVHPEYVHPKKQVMVEIYKK